MSAELERLKEKVRKDPNSRLFIPLADRYRKEGMVEEAVRVLTEGLGKHPGYMSARVALGKIYLEENRLEGALAEFSKVADAIPDNLFAQRKLAGIYMMMNDARNARTALETVVRLNPLDTEAKEALERLEGGLLPGPPEDEGHGTQVKEKETEMEVQPEKTVSLSFPGEEEASADEEIPVFSSEEIFLPAEPDVEGPSPVAEQPREPAETPPEDAVFEGGALNVGGSGGDIRRAEELIHEGQYARGFMVLRRRTELFPDDLAARQKLEELKALIRLLGLENEIRAAMLESFREAALKKNKNGTPENK